MVAGGCREEGMGSDYLMGTRFPLGVMTVIEVGAAQHLNGLNVTELHTLK